MTPSDNGRGPKEGAEPVIELEGACFGYGEAEIVHGIDLVIERGERVALLGPNGSGKSTVVRGLLGLNSHMDGRVELFREPLGAVSRRYRLGYVPQRHTLSAAVAATVTEVVLTGRLPHQGIFARPGTKDRAIVADALEMVGLQDRADHQVAHLSGGQHRRVLIARALAAQPEVLIMDEPTAGVDAASQDTFVEVLKRLADIGVTQLIVTHETAVMASLLTRVVAMRAGLIDFDGTPAAYLAHSFSEAGWAERHHGGSPEAGARPSALGLDGHTGMRRPFPPAKDHR